ncbi:MAG: metal-dependent hydrolase [Candidatus Nanoarchaeia archaeon]
MMLRTHFLFGILVSLLFIHFFPSLNAYLFIALVCAGSLIVDIDTSKSGVGRKARPLSWFLELFFGHRGFFHSLTAAIIIFLLSIYLVSFSFYAFAPAFGYLSHIFLDAFTMSGVPLFKPFSDRRLQGPIATGSFAEYVILFVVLFLDVYLVLDPFFTA